MPNKTIYIRPDDESLWERAEQYAERNRLSLSWLIARALDEYLDERGPRVGDGS
jgi:predicted transcriptional regulator